MEVTFTDDSGAQLSIQVIHYRAYLDWSDTNAVLTGIKSVSGNPGPVISKHNPDVPWLKLESAVRAAFESCLAFHTAPLPPQCPTTDNTTVDGGHVQWSLMGDPLVNAAAHFQASTGLIDVTGSFEMDAIFNEFLFGNQRGSESGNYDAIVAVDHGQIDVLQIVGN
jgi:hypothetical protein